MVEHARSHPGNEALAEAMARAGEVFRGAYSVVATWPRVSDSGIAATIPVGVSLLGAPNAVTLLAPNDVPVVIFDFSLPRVILDFCKSLSAEAFTSGRWRPKGEYAKASLDQRREWFFDNLALNWRLAGWWLDQGWRLGELDKDKTVPFYIMSALQTWFVVAHEYGHAVLGHLTPSSWEERSSLLLQARVRSFLASRQDEYDADAFALDSLLVAELEPPLESLSRARRAEAVDLLFSLFHFLEGAADAMADREPWSGKSPSHPHALARADNLRSQHGILTQDMDLIRDALTGMAESFARRWPETRSSLIQEEGLSNKSLL